MPPHPKPRRLLPLLLAGAAVLLLAGCKLEMAGGACTKVRSNELRVLTDQNCRFRYDQGDVASYVVMVTRAPSHGVAAGEGKYLKYTPPRGFVGEDRIGIKVVRKGVGHVQWEDLTVRVTVGPQA
jgi:hypothetical protein